MSLRALAALALVLVACVAAVLWLGRSNPPTPPGSALGALLDGPVEKVTAIGFGGAPSAGRIGRSPDGKWRIESPVAAAADPREVRSFLESLAQAKLLRVAEEKATDLDRFGLGAGASVLTIEREAGVPPRVIRLGRHSPVGPERYVAVGDGRVLLADLGGTAPDRTPESFRERRLFPLEPEAISRIAVQRPSGRLTILRRGGAWRLAEPLDDLADFGAADGLARSVTTLALSPAPTAESAKGGPAARPAPEITVTVESKEGTLTASIGASSGKGERPAWKGDGSGSGSVEDGGVAELLRPPEELREHRPWLFAAADLRGIRITGGGIDLRVEREKEASPWSARDGSAKATAVDGSKVDELTDRLRWLRAARVGEAGGAAWTPSLTIELSGEGKPIDRLELDRVPGPAAPAAPAGDEATCRARSASRPGAEFAVPLSQLAGLPRRAAELAAGAAPPAAKGAP